MEDKARLYKAYKGPKKTTQSQNQSSHPSKQPTNGQPIPGQLAAKQSLNLTAPIGKAAPLSTLAHKYNLRKKARIVTQEVEEADMDESDEEYDFMLEGDVLIPEEDVELESVDKEDLENEIPDDVFAQQLADYLAELQKTDDKELKTLKRTASLQRDEMESTISEWRKDKKGTSVTVKLDDQSRTLQGIGYFVKGGKAYEEELSKLINAVKKNHPHTSEGELHELVNQELLKGVHYESTYAEANSIGAINNTGETGRASFNQIEMNMVLTNPENSQTNPKALFKEQTTYAKAARKSDNEWKKDREKAIKAGRDPEEVDQEIAVKRGWESTMGNKLGGSQQSQYGTGRDNRRLKRRGSFEGRLNAVKHNVEQTILEEREKDRTREPRDLYTAYMADTFAETVAKTREVTRLNPKKEKP